MDIDALVRRVSNLEKRVDELTRQLERPQQRQVRQDWPDARSSDPIERRAAELMVGNRSPETARGIARAEAEAAEKGPQPVGLLPGDQRTIMGGAVAGPAGQPGTETMTNEQVYVQAAQDAGLAGSSDATAQAMAPEAAKGGGDPQWGQGDNGQGQPSPRAAQDTAGALTPRQEGVAGTDPSAPAAGPGNRLLDAEEAEVRTNPGGQGVAGAAQQQQQPQESPERPPASPAPSEERNEPETQAEREAREDRENRRNEQAVEENKAAREGQPPPQKGV